MPIEEYLAKIKSLTNNLAIINHPVLQYELVTRTLNGLPNTIEYQPIVCVHQNRENHISFDELKARLLVYKQRIKRAQSLVPSSVI